MCIAIYKPANTILSEETLQNSWNNNSDGGGFMFVENKKLIVIKGLMTFEAFKTAYEPHKNKECVIHFRIATHGKTDAKNTHPFFISENLGLVHNGIIGKVSCVSNKDMSDTWHFIDQHIKTLYELHPDFWINDKIKELIESYIGHSKIIFLDNDGNCDIYNEQLGSWDGLSWYSNNSYKQKPIYKNNIINKKNSLVQKTNTNVAQYQQPLLLKDVHIGKKYALKYQQLSFLNGISYDLAPGERVEVIGFSPAWIVVSLVSNPNIILEVPLWKLTTIPKETSTFMESSFTVGEEVIFSSNYNHFRIGDTKKIVHLAANGVFVEDLSKQKRYLIPKSCVRSTTSLIM